MMDITAFTDDWPPTRQTLQHLATHVLSQARQRHDGLFDLVPSPGGFATPPVGPSRERVRLAGDSLVIERVVGSDVRELEATTSSHPIVGASVTELCAAVGFEPDPAFWVGDDTPALGDPHAPIDFEPSTASALGEWYLLGQQAIDRVIATVADPAASVGRLWPEHFDYGTDLDAGTGVRCNLGAAGGDSFHERPYLYVGPWSDDRPGDAAYWNAPFGAVMSVDTIARDPDGIGRATAFLATGLEYLANSSPE